MIFTLEILTKEEMCKEYLFSNEVVIKMEKMQ